MFYFTLVNKILRHCHSESLITLLTNHDVTLNLGWQDSSVKRAVGAGVTFQIVSCLHIITQLSHVITFSS